MCDVHLLGARSGTTWSKHVSPCPPFCIWRWLQQPIELLFASNLQVQSPWKGHNCYFTREPKFPCFFFCTTLFENYSITWNKRQKHNFRPASFSMALWKILRHVYARIGWRNSFSFWSDRFLYFSYNFKTTQNRDLGRGWARRIQTKWRGRQQLFPLYQLGEINQVKFIAKKFLYCNSLICY